jgi:pimeloyl-ACP methyl ester carboxylesterase
MASWYEIGQDMIRFMDENGLSNTIGVGHSLGAVATMYAAIDRPDLFRAVVLIEPVLMMPAILQLFATTPIEGLTEDYPLIKISKSRRNNWPSREDAFDHYRPKRVFAKWSDDVLWDYIWHGLQRTNEGEIELIYAPEWEARIYSLPPTDVWDLIPKIDQPTLGIRGAETDTLVPAAWQLWQMAQPKGKFVNMANCTHLLPMEKPVEIAESIHNFLVELDD